MEKIYEESNQTPKKQKISFSVVLSFLVAAFAIVSLIAVGFNQISYAAPTTESKTIKFGMYENDVEATAYLKSPSQGITLRAPMMFFDSTDALTATQPAFCIEQGKNASDTQGAYSSGDEVYDDPGLIFIMNESGVLGGPGFVPDDAEYPPTNQVSTGTLNQEDLKALETYITQLAIWAHMQETYPAGDSRHGTDDIISILNQTWNVYSSRNESGTNEPIYSGNLYVNYIKPILEAASNATNHKTVRASLASKSISVVGDSDIYQTDKISVIANPASDLVNYSVDLYGLEGAYVVDKDGNKKTGLDTFAPGDYFYIRVPVNKVTEENKTVQIVIVGEFDNYLGGEYFLADGSQSVVTVTAENYRVANYESIDFMVTPPTGMTTAQTIYFIGLIVLLCGVGIIYANAKPVEEK